MTSRPPFAAGRTLVGARFIVPSRLEGRGEATPLPFVRPAAAGLPRSRRMRCHRIPTSGSSRHLKRVMRSKGDRKPESMLRSYAPSPTIRFPHGAPFEFVRLPRVGTRLPSRPPFAAGRTLGRGTIHRALLIARARRSHAPTFVRPAADGLPQDRHSPDTRYSILDTPSITLSPDACGDGSPRRRARGRRGRSRTSRARARRSA